MQRDTVKRIVSRSCAFFAFVLGVSELVACDSSAPAPAQPRPYDDASGTVHIGPEEDAIPPSSGPFDDAGVEASSLLPDADAGPVAVGDGDSGDDGPIFQDSSDLADVSGGPDADVTVGNADGGDANSDGNETGIDDANVPYAPLDAAMLSDASDGIDGGKLDLRISCGTRVCELPETCCVYESSYGAGPSYACAASKACPTETSFQSPVNLECGSVANCPAGTQCCIAGTQGSLHSTCQATCYGFGSAVLCDPNAVPTGCAATAPCSTNNVGDWSLTSAFATMRGRSALGPMVVAPLLCQSGVVLDVERVIGR